MKITSKTEEAISVAQARSLIGSNSYINEIAVICSIIRSVLWADSEAHYPIHTTRIVNQTIKFLLNPSSDSGCREEIKQCIDKLKYAGDLADFSKGRWLPASLREVILDPDLEESLLIGGVPTNVFPNRIRNKIVHHRQFRKIATGLIDEIHGLPKISLNRWAQIPTEDLETWANEIKDIKLEELTASIERRQFEIYNPSSQKQNVPQNFRWKQRFDGITGKFLCKNSTVTGTFYHIAELRGGAVVALSNPIPRKYSSRIMYAEDSVHEKSVIAIAEIRKGQLTVKLSNLVPLGEHMVFDALGESEAETTDFIVWRFDIKYQNVVFDTLQRLKIKIEG